MKQLLADVLVQPLVELLALVLQHAELVQEVREFLSRSRTVIAQRVEEIRERHARTLKEVLTVVVRFLIDEEGLQCQERRYDEETNFVFHLIGERDLAEQLPRAEQTALRRW